MPLLFAAGAAVAQEIPESSVPEQLLGMVGDWRLEQEDPALPVCTLTFTEEQRNGGWAIIVPEPCPAPYPTAAALAVWNIDEADGSVTILDATGLVTMRLLEGEDGLFHTTDTPALYLVLPWDDDGTGGEMGEEIKG